MNDYITIPFKNIDNGYTIDHILNINTRINDIKNIISSNIYTEFNLEVNEFDIYENEELTIIENDNFDSTLDQKYKNSIMNVCFYIKSVKVRYQDCPICMESLCSTNFRLLECSHSLCLECDNNWQHACAISHTVVSCPLCRVEY
jgi:hypothetical protein